MTTNVDCSLTLQTEVDRVIQLKIVKRSNLWNLKPILRNTSGYKPQVMVVNASMAPFYQKWKIHALSAAVIQILNVKEVSMINSYKVLVKIGTSQ